jgi:hypothetical protein
VKYTIILQRSSWLQEILDQSSSECLYIANPDIDFDDVQAAARAAKREAAKADLGHVRAILNERGMDLVKHVIDPDNYEVVFVFEGQPKIVVNGPRDPKVLAINDGFDA